MLKRQRRLLNVSLRRLLTQHHISPHSIALGFAIGISIGLGPTFGFQMIPTFIICSVLKCNRVAGVIAVWISNPLTVLPIYAFNFGVGKYIFGTWIGGESIKFETIKFVLLNPSWNDFVSLGEEAITFFLMGSLLVGLVGGLLAYFITKELVILHRARKKLLQQKKHGQGRS